MTSAPDTLAWPGNGRDVGRHAARFGLFAAWLGVVWFLSDIPDPSARVGIEWPLGDWAAHFIEYAAGGFAARLAFAPVIHGRARLGPFAFCAVWAVLDEWHQSFVPGRFSSIGDVAADLLGVGFGLAVHTALAAWLVGRASRSGLSADEDRFP